MSFLDLINSTPGVGNSGSSSGFTPGKTYGTPPQILNNLQQVESSGNPNAVNASSGATGAYQFLPSTVKMLQGQGVNFDPNNPEQARSAADYYLHQLYQQTGSWPKALAAYGGFQSKDPAPYVNKVLAGTPFAQTAPKPSGNYLSLINSTPLTPQPEQVSQQPTQPPSTMQNVASAVGSTPLGSAALGALKGAADTLVLGPAQLITKTAAGLYPSSWPGARFLEGTAEQQQQDIQGINKGYQAATAQHPGAAEVGNITGSVAGAAALPVGEVGEGANLFNKAIWAAKTGGLVGASQPVTGEGNFWANKAGQVGAGAVGGLVGYPVAAGVGKVGGWLAGKALGALGGKGAVQAAAESGALLPENAPPVAKAAVAAVKDHPDLIPEVANASPELQQKIVQTATDPTKQINPQALKNQIISDKFGIQLTPGQASEDPRLISMERNLRGKPGNEAMVYKLQDQNTQLVNGLDTLQKSAAPDVNVPNNFDGGQSVINAIQNKVDQQRQATSAAYKALADANGGDLPMDGQTFANNAEAALKKQMKGAFLPPQFKGLLEDFKSGEQPMTYENFENLRTMLGAAQRTAMRSGDGNAEHAINLVRDQLENMPLTSEVEGIKPLADQARALAKQGFDLERQIPAYKAVASGAAQPDNFARKYIVGGTVKDLKGLAGLLQDDPNALQTIKAIPVNHLRDAAVNQAGLFSQNGYNNALDSLDPKLSVLYSPEEIQNLKDLGQAARLVMQRPAGSFVNESNTDVANLARTAGGVAAHAVDVATHSPLGSIAQNAIAKQVAKKSAQKTLSSILEPGAGISVPSPAQKTLLRDIPNIAGRAGAVSLSSLLTRSPQRSQ